MPSGEPLRVPLPDLPVRALLPRLLAALGDAGAAVLVAPPGTGKTTLVPLALAGLGTGRVVVAEPRRLAARAAAARMADLCGSRVGDTVGFAVRGERRAGPRTVVEVVTTGVLLRRLQRDPSLDGVAAVVVDECHERHLETDLVLAMLADVRSALRDDLLVLATSATAQADLFAAVLAGRDGDAPVLSATVPSHPLAVRWEPPPARVRPAHGNWVDPALLDHVADVTAQALADVAHDGLVLVPGAREVDEVRSRLRARLPGLDVLALHGRLPAAQQDAALRPGARRRVVVATAVAESSLTVPGVRVVVDAGLARRPRTDHARGLATLVTTRLSDAEARQRAGRAHREGPGLVVRCWSEAEHDRLAAFPPPQVDQADLTGFALELACWGAPGGAGMPLPSPAPEGPLRLATSTLRELGATDASGRVTATGRRIAAVPAHPRLAAALLSAAATFGARRAAEVVALLSSDRQPEGDLVAALRQARREGDRTWRQGVAQLEDSVSTAPAAPAAARVPAPDDVVAGTVVATAFPERIARVRPGGGEYLMAGGTAATLPPGSPLAGSPWLAVAVAERGVGRASAVVRCAVGVHEDVALACGAGLRSEQDEVRWADGDVVARRVDRLGAIELMSRRVTDPDPEPVRAAVRRGLEQEGPSALRWTDAARELRDRMSLVHRTLGAPWPDVSDDALLATVDTWLPGIERVRRRADLARLDVTAGLRALLPWPDAARLDDLAPVRLLLPSGRHLRVDYSGDQPVVAARVQELFGWAGPAPLVDGRVPVVVHLLTPASRPTAITADLSSFWQNGYQQVRAELRGRYPRHPWPVDPMSAPPTSRAARRG